MSDTMNSPTCVVEAPPRRVGNRRVTVRYRCAPASCGNLYVDDDQAFQRAWLDNLSCSGVGLYLAKPVSPGAQIVLHLKETETKAVVEVAGHVVHVSLRDSFGWYIGLIFNRALDPNVLESLL